jgi:endoglucanase
MYVEDSWGAYVSNPQYFEDKVNEMVTDTINTRIYGIIDWHIHGNPNDHVQEASDFFSEISVAWGNCPHVIYEICNEPDGSTQWSSIKAYADTIIPIIKANDPDNLIIVGTLTWCQNPAAALVDPLSDPNTTYAFHFYAGSHGTDELISVDNALDNGCAIFCSEWGTTEYSASGHVYIPESELFISFLEQRSISWLNWLLSNKGETTSALKTSAGMNGPWSADNFSESGIFVKERITSPLLPYSYCSSIVIEGFGPEQGAKYYAEATVTIFDENGNPVSGVQVTGEWSGYRERNIHNRCFRYSYLSFHKIT